ncbi:MAG: PAS domain S-box protein [Gammaproteobacteria bacterium]|nr:PAS domain S-box protein [Gammaproteobacteria bacterium]
MNKTNRPEGDKAEIRSQQIKFIFDYLPLALLTNTISLCLVFVIFRPVSSPALLFGWSGGLFFITLIRGILWWQWKQQDIQTVEEQGKWLALFGVGVLATGLMWGLTVPLLVPEGSIFYLGFLALWVCGLCTGAITSIAIYRSFYYLFSLSALLPLTVFLLLSGKQIEMLLACVVTLYFIFTSVNANQTHKVLLKNISLDSDNSKLLATLKSDIEKNKLELLNEINQHQHINENLDVFDEIINASNDFIAFIDRDYIYRTINRKFSEEFDISTSKIVGEKVPNIIGKKVFNEEIKPALDACFMGEEVKFTYWGDFEGRGNRCFELHYYPRLTADGEINGVISYSRDITETQLTNDKLRESQRYYKQAEQLGKLGYWEWDHTRDCMVSCSESFADFYEMSVEEALKFFSHPDYELEAVHPEDRKRYAQHMNECERLKRGPDIEHRILTPSGVVRHIHLLGEYELDEKGEIKSSFGVEQDISKRKLDEEALRINEARLRDSQRMAKVGNWHWLYSKEEITISDELRRINGLEGSDAPFTREKFLEILHPDDRDRLKNNIEQMQETGVSDNSDYRIIWPDGSEHYVSSHREIIYDENGNNTGITGTVQEITERKKTELALKTSEERFHAAFDNTAIAMSINKLDGPYMIVNPAMSRFTGYTETELLSLTNLSITHPDDIEQTQANCDYLIEGHADHFLMEKRYIHKNGKEIWGLLSVAIVRDAAGEPLYFVPQIQDITERKKLEEELLKHQSRLETEVKHRTGELASVNKELQAFAHSVSHDLKAPLRTIEGYTDILKEDYGTQLDDAAQDYLSEIGEGAVRMGEMVDDLLWHATLGQGFVDVEMIDMNTTLEKVKRNLAGDIKEKRARIYTQGDLGEITGHKATIEALLQNLISNAIKYVEDEVTPDVLISASETETEFVISVRDNGIGIDKDHQKKIFGIFERLHTLDEYPGTGIGLAIAEKAAQLHGGRLWLDSEPGKGTTFYFSIIKQHDNLLVSDNE